MSPGVNRPEHATTATNPHTRPGSKTQVGGEIGPVVGSLCTGASGRDLGALAVLGGRLA